MIEEEKAIMIGNAILQIDVRREKEIERKTESKYFDSPLKWNHQWTESSHMREPSRDAFYTGHAGRRDVYQGPTAQNRP